MAKDGVQRMRLVNVEFRTFAHVELPDYPNMPEVVEWLGRIFYRDEHAGFFREIKPHKLTHEEFVLWPNQ